jgi:hypothetical protein
MKLYEYLASGLHVVARSLPSLDVVGVGGIATYENDNEALKLVQAALALPPNVGGLDVASQHSWTAKASALESFVDRCLMQDLE